MSGGLREHENFARAVAFPPLLRGGPAADLFGGESEQLIRYRSRHFLVAFRVGVQEICVLFVKETRVGGRIRI